jgi:Rrf2 family transcriptional regulator, cysteine metabolism repressor
MKFSQKTVYALRAAFELAKHYQRGPVSVHQLAETQLIPGRFLENILVKLKQSGIVESVRGKEGGYLLAREPNLVKVGDILRAIEGSLDPVSCLNGRPQGKCPMQEDCVFIPMWREARDAVVAVYDGTTIADLLSRSESTPRCYVADYCI